MSTSAPDTESIMQRLANWWRARSELSDLSADEVERLAHDIGMTAAELETVASKGEHGADLLYARMAALGISRADVDRLAFGLIRDLERDCCCCSDKDVCARDLAKQPDAPGWMTYCNNAVTLDAISRTKGRAPI